MKHPFLYIFLLVPFVHLNSQNASIDSSAKPRLFEDVFSSKHPIDSSFPETFHIVQLGSLKVETGKLIICDPVEMHLAKPIAQTFPIGKFPVELAILDSYGIETVAYCRVRFSDKKITKWVLVLREGEKIGEALQVVKTQFYCADAVTDIGIIIDKSVNGILLKKSHFYWASIFLNFADKKNGKMFAFATHSLALFHCFYGPTAKTYVGLDSEGKICRLLVDGGGYTIPPSQF